MKTGKYFSLKELADVSYISDRQARSLTDYGLIEKKDNSPKYKLNEVVFCRVVHYLRNEFSMQQVRDVVHPCNYYDDNLINDPYAFIFIDEREKFSTGTLDTMEYRRLMKDSFVSFDKKILYKKDGRIQRNNFICFNLGLIREDLIEQSIALGLDSIDLKFEELATQPSPALTV